MRLFSLFLILFIIAPQSQAEAYQALKKKIEKTYGIKIEFDKIRSRDSNQIKGVSHPRSRKKRKRTLQRLLTDLRKYDVSLIRKYVRKIYLAKYLELRNREVAGTYEYSKKSIYLISRYIGGVNQYATTFHHEFSSFLLFKHYTEEFYQRWTAHNPRSFTYFKNNVNGKDSLDGKSGVKGHPKFYKQGFVFGYGTSSFHNDFNTFFELMIGAPARFVKLEGKYPAIRKKAKLLREFYYDTVLPDLKKKKAVSKR